MGLSFIFWNQHVTLLMWFSPLSVCTSNRFYLIRHTTWYSNLDFKYNALMQRRSCCDKYFIILSTWMSILNYPEQSVQLWSSCNQPVLRKLDCSIWSRPSPFKHMQLVYMFCRVVNDNVTHYWNVVFNVYYTILFWFINQHKLFIRNKFLADYP